MKKTLFLFLFLLFLMGCSASLYSQKDMDAMDKSYHPMMKEKTSSERGKKNTTQILQSPMLQSSTTSTSVLKETTTTQETPLVIIGEPIIRREAPRKRPPKAEEEEEKEEEEKPEEETIPQTEQWWQPHPGLTWHWQLQGTINTNYPVDVYDIDLFDTPQAIIDQLHNQGKKVICYFSAGSWEAWREDAKDFPLSVLGNPLEDWPDEKWLNIAAYEQFASIMQKRLDLAKTKHCDAVEPDNIDGYQNNNGFGFSAEDQLQYNKWLAEEAHKRGLAIGLKNDLLQVKEFVDIFDFAINEQCFYYQECEYLLPFLQKNKAVFGVEYELEPEQFCLKANAMNFSWLKMNYDLAGDRFGCEAWKE